MCYNQANGYGRYLGHLEHGVSAVFQTDFGEAHNQRRLFGRFGEIRATVKDSTNSAAVKVAIAVDGEKLGIVSVPI